MVLTVILFVYLSLFERQSDGPFLRQLLASRHPFYRKLVCVESNTAQQSSGGEGLLQA